MESDFAEPYWFNQFCYNIPFHFTELHYSTVFHFYTPWKRQKSRGFLTFSGGIEMEHCRLMEFSKMKAAVLRNWDIWKKRHGTSNTDGFFGKCLPEVLTVNWKLQSQPMLGKIAFRKIITENNLKWLLWHLPASVGCVNKHSCIIFTTSLLI